MMQEVCSMPLYSKASAQAGFGCHVHTCFAGAAADSEGVGYGQVYVQWFHDPLYISVLEHQGVS